MGVVLVGGGGKGEAGEGGGGWYVGGGVGGGGVSEHVRTAWSVTPSPAALPERSTGGGLPLHPPAFDWLAVGPLI